MKWVLLIAGGLVLIVAIVAVIGSLLPRDHTAGRTLTIRRSPPEVWPVLTRTMNASSVPVDVLESDPPRRLVTRVNASEKMFGGTWTIAIAPAADGSTITVREDGWVANPIFRFVSRFVLGHHATMDGILKQVAKELGEPTNLSGQ